LSTDADLQAHQAQLKQDQADCRAMLAADSKAVYDAIRKLLADQKAAQTPTTGGTTGTTTKATLRR